MHQKSVALLKAIGGQSSYLALALAILCSLNAFAVDKALQPPKEVNEYQSAVLKDMGVVQRKAMNKGERFILATNFSFDFSDGPYTNYYLQLSPGYAFSDFWEVTLHYAPFFISNPRSIVTKVENLDLLGGGKASILYNKPKYALGAEIVWAPMYGKDSLGINHLVRSDTFFKGGFSRVTYTDDSGMRYFFGFGKTYFLGSSAGFRASVVLNYVQTIVDNQKKFAFQAALELGGIYYF